MDEPNWRAFNRANWDERVDLHLGADSYDLGPLRSGHGKLTPIEEAEIGSVAGLNILHLQCHFGRDTLTLAQRGARVVGLDFSSRAIAVARGLADELGLTERALFIEADLYDAPQALSDTFDLVFVNWGALVWLPDIQRWAQIVAHFLKPGAALYLAEGHPYAEVFDDEKRLPDGMPGYFIPYFVGKPLVFDDPSDYASPALLRNAIRYEWLHPLSETISTLSVAGLNLRWLHEHDSLPFQRYQQLVKGPDGMYRWPAEPWLPLSFSLRAEKLKCWS
jgi:SAM-dependent methyltransferase